MKHVSAQDLRKMSVEDLRKEENDLRLSVAKLRMGIRLQAEKDSAKLTRDKKQLARTLTILNELAQKNEASPLKKAKKSSKISAPKAA